MLAVFADVKPSFTRVWAMPSAETFSIPPIRQLVSWHLHHARVSVDPFARNSRAATFTNDLNPGTAAEYHMDAVDFLRAMATKEVIADLVLLDPPYSPRQITECYAAAGLKATTSDTQNSRFMADVRDAVEAITRRGSVVLSFGWNSTGMGDRWTTDSIMLVCHGGAHNDTICLVQRQNEDALLTDYLASHPVDRSAA